MLLPMVSMPSPVEWCSGCHFVYSHLAKTYDATLIVSRLIQGATFVMTLHDSLTRLLSRIWEVYQAMHVHGAVDRIVTHLDLESNMQCTQLASEPAAGSKRGVVQAL